MRPFIVAAAVMGVMYFQSAITLGRSDGPAPVDGPVAANSRAPFGNLVILLVYDNVGVTRPEMAIAQKTANAILALASLRTEWHSCSEDPPVDPLCSQPLPYQALIVRIVEATRVVRLDSLGSASVDPEQGTGVLATVYLDRVHSLAARAGVPSGPLLGRTITHELGHLLIGSTAHAERGLMRPRWSVGEVRRDFAMDWRWSPRDLVEIAGGREGRTRHTASIPTTVVNGAGSNRR